MHVSLKVFESHAELIECDMSEFLVESEAGYRVVTLATTNINFVVYFELGRVAEPAMHMSCLGGV